MQAIPSLTPFIEGEAYDRVIDIEVELPPLIPGFYSVGVWTGSSLSSTLDEVREALEFHVADSPTPGRTVPHASNRGHIVPVSRIVTVSAEKELIQ
jgi:hypothetical protein